MNTRVDILLLDKFVASARTLLAQLFPDHPALGPTLQMLANAR